MKIVVVGCGKVGFGLAKQLADEGHDITLVDTDAAKIKNAVETLDIQGVTGNGTLGGTLKEAGINESDLMIAVTGKDEINLLCCLVAKKTANCNTIARVRNPEYKDEIGYLQGELGLSMVINPELACSDVMGRLIEVPSANDITSFAKGRINLIKLRVPENSVVHGMTIYDYSNKIQKNTLICAIQRGDNIIIPNGETEMFAGDDMYAIVPRESIQKFFDKIGVKAKHIKRVMILGGSVTAYYLANYLSAHHFDVKIIERDFARCEELSDMLPKVSIINGDVSDRDLLSEEKIAEMDAVVSLTNMDEENMVLSMLVSKLSDAKVITKLNKVVFEEVIKDMPLGTVVSPRDITAKSILQYVRAMQNSLGSNIETLYRLLDDRVEALEFRVKQESEVVGKPLMELNLKPELLVCAIVRGKKVITPSGSDVIQDGDTVVVVTTKKGLNDIKDILA